MFCGTRCTLYFIPFVPDELKSDDELESDDEPESDEKLSNFYNLFLFLQSVKIRDIYTKGSDNHKKVLIFEKLNPVCPGAEGSVCIGIFIQS